VPVHVYLGSGGIRCWVSWLHLVRLHTTFSTPVHLLPVWLPLLRTQLVTDGYFTVYCCELLPVTRYAITSCCCYWVVTLLRFGYSHVGLLLRWLVLWFDLTLHLRCYGSLVVVVAFTLFTFAGWLG